MGLTKIEWTGTPRADGTIAPGYTFNVVWGCSKVSEACRSCYAEALAKRYGHDVWGPNKPRRILSDSNWRLPFKWNLEAEKAGERRRVFCSSMADVFEDHPTVAEQRLRLWPIIAQTPHLDWLLLTKRPENMVKFAPEAWAERWPDNVWAGATCENQPRLEYNVPWLLEVPARVLFLSIEPMLGEMDLENVEPYYLKPDVTGRERHPLDPVVRIDCLRGHVKGPDDMLDRKIGWVIVGGESGPGSRPFILSQAMAVVRQCQQAGCPVFVKQLGARPYEEACHEEPLANEKIKLADPKGGDWNEWPYRSLKVRQFPEVRS